MWEEKVLMFHSFKNEETKVIYKIYELQNRLNEKIKKKWLDEIPIGGWILTITSELNEFVDTYNWEWWKKKNENLTNAYIEYADLLHFVPSLSIKAIYDKLSEGGIACDVWEYVNLFFYHLDLSITTHKKSPTCDMVYSGKKKSKNEILIDNLSKITTSITSILNNFTQDKLKDSTFLEVIQNLVKLNIGVFFTLRELFLKESMVKMYDIYRSKMILNEFRKKHGYKEGKYIKNWNGVEDNHRLIDFILKNKNRSLSEEEIWNFLESEYVKVKEG